MKKIITTMADSATEAIEDVRNWYEILEIPLIHAPVVSRCRNPDHGYRVVVQTAE